MGWSCGLVVDWSWVGAMVGHGVAMVGHEVGHGLVMGRSWSVMVGHGCVCVCGACAPPTPTNTILLYLHDTHQTSPQLFPLNAAGPLKLARPSAHSRASMSADEATGPSASTPGARSFYSDWELVGRVEQPLAMPRRPVPRRPVTRRPVPCRRRRPRCQSVPRRPVPRRPGPRETILPNAVPGRIGGHDPPRRRARQHWRPDPSPDRGCTRGALV